MTICRFRPFLWTCKTRLILNRNSKATQVKFCRLDTVSLLQYVSYYVVPTYSLLTNFHISQSPRCGPRAIVDHRVADHCVCISLPQGRTEIVGCRRVKQQTFQDRRESHWQSFLVLEATKRFVSAFGFPYSTLAYETGHMLWCLQVRQMPPAVNQAFACIVCPPPPPDRVSSAYRVLQWVSLVVIQEVVDHHRSLAVIDISRLW